MCPYKSEHTNTQPIVVAVCFDLILTRRCFVCQLNNGLPERKASHCHNYSPAVMNPICIHVRDTDTPQRFVCSGRALPLAGFGEGELRPGSTHCRYFVPEQFDFELVPYTNSIYRDYLEYLLLRNRFKRAFNTAH